MTMLLFLTVCVGMMLSFAQCTTVGPGQLMCYSCSDIKTSEECMNVTTCVNGEHCYGRADGKPSGDVSYTVGCTRDTAAVMGMYTFCSDTCRENLCNLDKCHLPISPTSKSDRPPRCLSCDFISNPSLCTNIVQCQSDQICYTREFTVYGNQRYRMGCIDKQHCSSTPTTQSPSSPQLVGKRSPASPEIVGQRSVNASCSLCCGKDHCNTGACDTQHHFLGDSFDLKLLDSQSTCVDSNPMACTSFGQLNTDACSILPNVDVMCPATCGICGHFGWSSWNEWSSCSATCNDGLTTRTRTCLHQVDVSHPHSCPGNHTETYDCNLGPCPVEGNWTTWESWGECSRTCSNGTKVRVRQCSSSSLQQGGLYCEGDRLEETDCNDQACPVETACPDDWISHGQSCYFFGHTSMTFDNSRAFCEHREATLVQIQSSEENQFIVNHLSTLNHPGDGWWLGIKYVSYYRWTWYPNNTRISYTNWYPGEGTSSNEDCAVLYPPYNFTMADSVCTWSTPKALCERHHL